LKGTAMTQVNTTPANLSSYLLDITLATRPPVTSTSPISAPARETNETKAMANATPRDNFFTTHLQ
jgi:hypothetical protein